jgi:VIT1/CCC1 family predicted Fe2+/Mn2+ transporter
VSAVSFALGAALPLAVATLAPVGETLVALLVSSPLVLALLGAVAARAGGARITVGALRVAFWGALAMGATCAVGTLFR